MEFHRLSAAFYTQFGHFEEILTKDERPYYASSLDEEITNADITLKPGKVCNERKVKKVI